MIYMYSFLVCKQGKVYLIIDLIKSQQNLICGGISTVKILSSIGLKRNNVTIPCFCFPSEHSDIQLISQDWGDEIKIGFVLVRRTWPVFTASCNHGIGFLIPWCCPQHVGRELSQCLLPVITMALVS